MDLHGSRILIHSDFVEEVYSKEDYKKWFTKLRGVSLKYPNIMCDKHFSKCTKLKDKEGKRLRGDVLLSFVSPQPITTENPDSEIQLLMKVCIQLSSKKPYKTLIFCSKESKEKFIALPDYNYDSVKEGVKILTTEEALIVLDVI